MKKIERKNITQFVYYGEIVFDGVTDDFYVTCKFNKIMALYCIMKLDPFQIKLYYNLV